jgi:hypothetical protein
MDKQFLTKIAVVVVTENLVEGDVISDAGTMLEAGTLTCTCGFR